MNNGIITKINKNLYTISSDIGVFVCEQRGNLYKNKIKPTVGDYVIFDPKNSTIEEILERKNTLIRPFISNIDKLIIVTSTHIPKFSSYLLDKQLILSDSNNIKPIIVFTKEDLISFKEKINLLKYKKYYKNLGYKVYNNTEIFKLKKEFIDSVVALTGQTGAGKSTLLNKIDKNLNLETNDISVSLGRGKHTTRIVQLYPLNSGFIADTPGFSSLNLNFKKEKIKEYYKEFNLDCKYKGCLHIKEDGCKVKSNLKKNKIYNERYKNYIKLVSEVEKC